MSKMISFGGVDDTEESVKESPASVTDEGEFDDSDVVETIEEIVEGEEGENDDSAIILKSGEVYEDIDCGENGTLIVEGDCIVKSFRKAPVSASGILNIKGEGTLTIESNGTRQPCIGISTENGNSFGKWKTGSGDIEGIIIEGVRVICKGIVPNFTLGKYGCSGVPSIALKGDAHLVCPEIKGNRRMIRGDEDGVGDAVYELV